MAGSVNKVILVGNVGKDPEIRSMQDGREVASFSLATSDSWRDKQTGERKERTEWHRVSIFGDGLVNVVKNYVKKGSKVFVEGALQTRKWTDNNGVEKFTTEIVLQGFGGTLTLLDSRNANSGASEGNSDNSDSRPTAPAFSASDIDDDIPI